MINFRSATAPLQGAYTPTASDSTDLPRVGRALYVGGTGAVKVTMEDGTTPTFAAMPVGLYPLRIKRVWTTGTTATNLLILE